MLINCVCVKALLMHVTIILTATMLNVTYIVAFLLMCAAVDGYFYVTTVGSEPVNCLNGNLLLTCTFHTIQGLGEPSLGKTVAPWSSVLQSARRSKWMRSCDMSDVPESFAPRMDLILITPSSHSA